MKRVAAWAALLLVIGLSVGYAQENEHGKGEPAEESGNLEIWKWANFALLAAGLGYLVKKNAGPYFAKRGLEIRKQMVEAEEIRKEAEHRVAAIEARLANLQNEIAALKTESLAEQEAEVEQFRLQNAAEIAKIQSHAQREIEAAGKQARLELRRHAAAVAMTLAEQKIRARMTPEAQGALVDSFLRNLEPSARAQTN